MTSDSYSRYLRSAMYKDCLEGARKKGSGRSFGLPKLSSAKLNLVGGGGGGGGVASVMGGSAAAAAAASSSSSSSAKLYFLSQLKKSLFNETRNF